MNESKLSSITGWRKKIRVLNWVWRIVELGRVKSASRDNSIEEKIKTNERQYEGKNIKRERKKIEVVD